MQFNVKNIEDCYICRVSRNCEQRIVNNEMLLCGNDLFNFLRELGWVTEKYPRQSSTVFVSVFAKVFPT